MAQNPSAQTTWADLSVSIDERINWLLAISSLLESQSEVSDLSPFPEAEAIGSIGWLQTHLLKELQAHVDALYDLSKSKEN